MIDHKDLTDLKVSGLSVEKIELLKAWYEMHTGNRAESIESLAGGGKGTDLTKRMDRLIKLGIWAEQHGISALEYASCNGMDDAAFYSEDNLAEGMISIANRTRDALAQIQKEVETG